MVPIKYQVVGEEDYAFDVKISSDGKYEVNSGTYTSQPPRTGMLSEAQEAEQRLLQTRIQDAKDRRAEEREALVSLEEEVDKHRRDHIRADVAAKSARRDAEMERDGSGGSGMPGGGPRRAGRWPRPGRWRRRRKL